MKCLQRDRFCLKLNPELLGCTWIHVLHGKHTSYGLALKETCTILVEFPFTTTLIHRKQFNFKARNSFTGLGSSSSLLRTGTADFTSNGNGFTNIIISSYVRADPTSEGKGTFLKIKHCCNVSFRAAAWGDCAVPCQGFSESDWKSCMRPQKHTV